MEIGPEDNCDGLTSTNTAAAASSSTQAMLSQRMPDAEATNRDNDASCNDHDPSFDDEEEEIFFGPVSDKEKKKASAYARRRTAVFKPGASGNHLRKRVTMAPNDLLPTLSEMGADDKSRAKSCNGTDDSPGGNNETEKDHACCKGSSSGGVDSMFDQAVNTSNGAPSDTMASSDSNSIHITNGLICDNSETEKMVGFVPKDMEKVLRRESLLVIQELKNHRKEGKRCDDLDCSLCVLDDDHGKVVADCIAKDSIITTKESISPTDCQTSSTVPSSSQKIVNGKDNYNPDESVTASDGYNSDDDFLLMEQSCHESFTEDSASPEKADKLDSTIDCITRSITKLRMKPLTDECRSVHAFSRYTPIRQAQSPSLETFVAATPEDDGPGTPGVVFTENSFSPNLLFKDVRKPLLFNDKSEESHAASSESLTEYNNAADTATDLMTSSMTSSLECYTQPDLRIDGEMNATLDIIDVACQDKSSFDLNAIEAMTSSENSFEQDTSDSVCSSEEGSNKENQPQISSRQVLQTPPLQRVQRLRHVVSEQRPSSLHIRTIDEGSSFSPTSVEGASPMTMEEILARKKAQMQQLRQDQQKFTEKLTTRHSPSPARELGGKKGLRRSPLTGSFRSPTARLPNTLPRVRYKDSQSVSLEGKQLEAVTKLHTMCNSQRSVKLVHRPRKGHCNRIVTVVADERQRIKWSDLRSVTPDQTDVIEDSPDSGKSGRRKSIIKVRPNNYLFPYGDESPSSVIISKMAHHASSLQRAVIDKFSPSK